MNWPQFLWSCGLSALTTLAMMRWIVPRELRGLRTEVKRERAEADLWHGRCLFLQKVVNALAEGNAAEARRLLRETKDEVMMRALGRVPAPPSEKS